MSWRRRGWASWRPTWAKPAGASLTSRFATAARETDGDPEIAARHRLQRRLATLSNRPTRRLNGRGIVMLVGGHFVASAWVCLTRLKDLGCRLPVEIWYLGDADLPPHVRHLLGEFAVDFVDAGRHPAAGADFPTSGWQLKAFAILHSHFAEVLYLDADNVPLIDPATLFDLPEYRRGGALFWPDIRANNPYSPVWSICGLEPPAGPEWEAGQLVVDKRRHWAPLELALFFNQESDFYYQYLMGDKDTFQLAWRLLRRHYAMTGYPPVRARAESGELLGLWQHDFAGAELFLHRTDAEWTAHGRNRPALGFADHAHCQAALAELAGRWDGRLAPVPRPAAAAATAEEIVLARRFRYYRGDLDARPLELLEGGRIGEGRARAERSWRFEEADGSLVLEGYADDTCALRLDADGVWRGRWFNFEQSPVELIPLGAADSPSGAGPSRPSRPRLLFLSPVMPADRGNGLAMRAASVLRRLCRDYRVTLVIAELYPPALQRELPDWVRPACEAVHWVSPPALPSGLQDRADDQLRDQEWSARILRAVRADSPRPFDVLHVFRLALLPLVEQMLADRELQRADWHLDLDDLESRTERGFATLARRAGQPGGAPAALRRAATARLHEDRLLAAWDRLYVCSRLDRDDLLARPVRRRAEVIVLPNVVEVPVNPPAAPRREPLTILFLGSFGYFPNKDAAAWLCREVVPVIRELTATPFRVLLVGTGGVDELQALALIPEVDYLGPIEHVADAYRQADIVAVPLRAGGGTRIKLLEALAHGRPVVSTTIGAEGLELRDGDELLIADRAFHFAQQCVRLLHDPELARRLAERGRERVLADYTRPELSEELELVKG